MNDRILPENTFNAIINYLVNQPYNQVAQLLQLMAGLQPLNKPEDKLNATPVVPSKEDKPK